MHFGRTITEAIHDISQDLSTTAEDMQGAKLIEGHTKDLLAAGHQGDVSATSTPSTSITFSSYKDPEKAVKALTKTYKAIAAGGRANAVILKAAPRVSDEFEKHRGFTLTQVVLKFDFDATVADLPEQVRKRHFNRSHARRDGHVDRHRQKIAVQITAKIERRQELLDKSLDGKQSVEPTRASNSRSTPKRRVCC